MNRIVRPELRYWRIWFAIGLIMALGIATVCLVPSQSLPSVGVSDKWEHLLAFAVLSFWFGSIAARRDLWWLSLLSVAFGGLIEAAQGLMHLGRYAEWGDFVADAIGVAIGTALVLTPLGGWARWIEVRLSEGTR